MPKIRPINFDSPEDIKLFIECAKSGISECDKYGWRHPPPVKTEWHLYVCLGMSMRRAHLPHLLRGLYRCYVIDEEACAHVIPSRDFSMYPIIILFQKKRPYGREYLDKLIRLAKKLKKEGYKKIYVAFPPVHPLSKRIPGKIHSSWPPENPTYTIWELTV